MIIHAFENYYILKTELNLLRELEKISSSHRLSVMTKYEPEVKGAKFFAFEQHNGQQCRYVRQSEVRNVNGSDHNKFKLIFTHFFIVQEHGHRQPDRT